MLKYFPYCCSQFWDCSIFGTPLQILNSLSKSLFVGTFSGKLTRSFPSIWVGDSSFFFFFQWIWVLWDSLIHQEHVGQLEGAYCCNHIPVDSGHYVRKKWGLPISTNMNKNTDHKIGDFHQIFFHKTYFMNPSIRRRRKKKSQWLLF